MEILYAAFKKIVWGLVKAEFLKYLKQKGVVTYGDKTTDDLGIEIILIVAEELIPEVIEWLRKNGATDVRRIVSGFDFSYLLQSVAVGAGTGAYAGTVLPGIGTIFGTLAGGGLGVVYGVIGGIVGSDKMAEIGKAYQFHRF